MTKTQRQLRLALGLHALPGPGHLSDWHQAPVTDSAEKGVAADQQQVQLARQGKFDFALIADGIFHKEAGRAQTHGRATSVAASFAQTALGTDVVFTAQRGLREARLHYGEVKRSVLAKKRRHEALFMMQIASFILGDTEEEALDTYNRTIAVIPIKQALLRLGTLFAGHDFTRYELDGPFPDVAALGELRYAQATERLLSEVWAERLSVRQAALRSVAPKPMFVGTARQMAGGMQLWFEGRGADGFLLLPGAPDALARFVEQVVPLLQERGLYKMAYEVDAERDYAGLALPNAQSVMMDREQELSC